MKVKANGINMNYESKGKGENLVFIHGFGDTLGMWYHQVPFFSKNYRVIAYDVRGSGKTESPEGEYSIPVFADDAYELMKAMKVETAYFLGYSMGGRIALELALNHPEMVRALILANSPVVVPRLSPDAAERRPVILEPLARNDIKSFAEMMTTGAFSPGFKSKNPIEFEKYLGVKLQNKPDSLAKVMQSLNSMLASPPDLSKLKCSALIIVGENDQYLGVGQGNKAREAIPGSKLVILPTGHASAIESPGEFNSAVEEFLSSFRGILPLQ